MPSFTPHKFLILEVLGYQFNEPNSIIIKLNDFVSISENFIAPEKFAKLEKLIFNFIGTRKYSSTSEECISIAMNSRYRKVVKLHL